MSTLTKIVITHDDLVNAAGRHLAGTRRCGVVLIERGSCSEIPDVIGWLATGHSILIECKMSLGDFRADRRKHFRRAPYRGMGSERWFLTPAGLLAPSDVPEKWGLMEYRGGRVYRIIYPTQLRENEYNHRVERRLLISELSTWQTVIGYQIDRSNGDSRWLDRHRMVKELIKEPTE